MDVLKDLADTALGALVFGVFIGAGCALVDLASNWL